MQGARVVRQLPYALLATVAVVVAPALLVAALPGAPGPFVGIPVCVVLSLAIARAAATLWRRSKRSREVLFADLMLWGWVRRLFTERRLAKAESVLTETGEADADRRLRALERVSAMLESRDAYTRHHSLRVTRYSEAIARGLELGDVEVARVRQAAVLHDVGKFFTPRAVLNKPGRLTDEEFDVVKRHPGQGADMLRGVVEPEVEAMIRHHHERLGGNGYPDKLAGDAIPLGARIIAVADTFDAMTSTRAYRSARPHTLALEVLREEAGVALDAQAVAAFAVYYTGRRGIGWSSVASGMTQALAPLRELLLPAARALPALGAAVVFTAPVVVGEAAPRATARPDAAKPRVARIGHRFAAPGRALAAPAPRHRGSARRSASDESVTVPRDKITEGGKVPTVGAPSTSKPTPADDAPEQVKPTPATATTPSNETDSGPSPSSPADPAPTETPAPAATEAPTDAPEVTTPPVVVGETEIIPEIEVPVPDLPVELPIPLPDIKVPPIKLP